MALTCKKWFEVSRDSELWKSRFLLQFKPISTEADACYRRKFIAYQKGNCWSCKTFLPLEDIELICPIRKRPLCKDCSEDNPACFIESVHSFIGIRVFVYQRVKKCYKAEFAGKMIIYAEKRRALLLDMIERDYSNGISAGLKAETGDFGIIDLYGSGEYGFRNLGYLLAGYFGRNESREDLKATIACSKVAKYRLNRLLSLSLSLKLGLISKTIPASLT